MKLPILDRQDFHVGNSNFAVTDWIETDYLIYCYQPLANHVLYKTQVRCSCAYRLNAISFAAGSTLGGATEPGSVRGRPVTYSGDSLMDSRAPESAQGHPVTYSGGLSTIGSAPGRSVRDQPEAYLDSFGVGSTVGSALELGSVRGRPVTYSGGSMTESGAPESAQGHPVTFSGGLSTLETDAGRSMRDPAEAYPVTFGAGSSVGTATDLGSVRGRPVSYSGTSIMDSEAPESAQGYPLTYSGGLSTIETDAGQSTRGQPEAYPVSFAAGSTVGTATEPGSVRGRPITFSGDSIMDSGAPASARGHPVTLSGVSSRGPEAQQSRAPSVRGQPIVFSGDSFMESEGPSSPGRGQPTQVAGRASSGSLVRLLIFFLLRRVCALCNAKSCLASNLCIPALGLGK